MGSRRADPDAGRWTTDTAVAVLSMFLIMGATFDFQAHHSGISFAEEGFFTHSHVIVYTTAAAITAIIARQTYRNRQTGESWLGAIPTGYGWGLVGLGVFWLGGLGDFWWHTTFGFEQGAEGLMSPSHLMIACGAGLLVTSPLRAAWNRDTEPRGLEYLPVVISAGLVFSLLALFGGWVNPLSQPNPTPTMTSHTAIMIGISGLQIFSVILVGGMQALTHRFRLPFGALTVIFGMPAVATAIVWGTGEFVVTVVLTGLVADTFVRWRRPTPATPRALRVFGGLIPVVFVGSYMGVIGLTAEIAWTASLWMGAIFAAGLAGLLLTYAIVPSAATQAAGRGPSV